MPYYYSISEVSKKTNVKPYVLRYWEKEFKQLRPRKTKYGRRAYTEKDIELILLIKKLLYEEQYTIEGAREKLKRCQSDKDTILKEIEKGLKEVLSILE